MLSAMMAPAMAVKAMSIAEANVCPAKPEAPVFNLLIASMASVTRLSALNPLVLMVCRTAEKPVWIAEHDVWPAEMGRAVVRAVIVSVVPARTADA